MKDCGTPKVVEIKCPGRVVLFHQVNIPAEMGDETTNPPQIGEYRNVLLVYEATGATFLYSSDGTFVRIANRDELIRLIEAEAETRQEADEDLQEQIDDIRDHTDVVDIVGTYAELEDYDTSKLGDNDIVKVLQDETKDDATTYYKWHKTTQSWEFIGEQGPYYTQEQTDDLLDEKQDTLTAGTGITIDENNVISSTSVVVMDDQLDFSSTNPVENQAIKNAIYAKRSGNYDQEVGVDIKYDDPYSSPYVAIGGVATGGRGSASVGIGYSSSAAGLGSVAIGDGAVTTDREQVAIGMLTKSSPYSTAVGARARTNFTGVTHAVAVGSSDVRGDYGVAIGNGAGAYGTNSIAIGKSASTSSGANNSLAIGASASVSSNITNAVAIGQGSRATESDTVSVGQSSALRRITNVGDAVNAQDAVTKNQLDTAIAGVTVPVMTGATATTAGTSGSVPAPAAGDQDKFLKGDGTWAVGGSSTTDSALSWTSTNPVENQVIRNTIFKKDSGSNSEAGIDFKYLSPVSNAYVNIGSNLNDTRGAGSVAIGYGASANTTRAIAIGQNSTATNSNPTNITDQIAIGYNTNCRSSASICIGDVAQALSNTDRSIVIGHDADVLSGSDNIVIGSTAGVPISGGSSNVVIGDTAKTGANVSNSVSLGKASLASESDTVSVGNSTLSTPTYRRVVNVADAVNAHDAVTKQQLDAVSNALVIREWS